MRVNPGFNSFEVTYNSGNPQAVSTTLIADLETPVSAMIKLAKARPNSFLMESVEGLLARGFGADDPDLQVVAVIDVGLVELQEEALAQVTGADARGLEALQELQNVARLVNGARRHDLGPLHELLVDLIAQVAVVACGIACGDRERRPARLLLRCPGRRRSACMVGCLSPRKGRAARSESSKAFA